jgi:hypothetical protein
MGETATEVTVSFVCEKGMHSECSGSVLVWDDDHTEVVSRNKCECMCDHPVIEGSWRSGGGSKRRGDAA